MNRYIIATTTEIDAENTEEAIHKFWDDFNKHEIDELSIIKQGTLTEAKRDDSTI